MLVLPALASWCPCPQHLNRKYPQASVLQGSLIPAHEQSLHLCLPQKCRGGEVCARALGVLCKFFPDAAEQLPLLSTLARANARLSTLPQFHDLCHITPLASKCSHQHSSTSFSALEKGEPSWSETELTIKSCSSCEIRVGGNITGQCPFDLGPPLVTSEQAELVHVWSVCAYTSVNI